MNLLDYDALRAAVENEESIRGLIGEAMCLPDYDALRAAVENEESILDILNAAVQNSGTQVYEELRYNHNHDSKGRFCSGSGESGGSGSSAVYKISSITAKIENDFRANRAVIDSDEYADKFNDVVILPAVQERIVETVRDSIYENDGTQNETVTFLNKWTGKQIGKKYHHKYKGGLTAGGMITVPNSADNSLILVHNHGNSSPFSFNDFYLLNECPQVKTIIAAGHNGIVYKMSVGSGKRLDMNNINVYNETKRKFSLAYNLETGDLKALEQYCGKLGWRFEYE